MKSYLTAAIVAGTLAGCSENGAGGEFAYFDREAGARIDSGDFGNATMNNTLVQSGHSGLTINLNNRFAGEVTSTVNFAFNSSQLDANARATLDQQANWIKQFPEVRFKVFGHTDLVGSNAYNQGLGLQRAQTVVQYLTSQGISRSRLEAVVSFGETQPLIVTQGMERQNRRTVTEVSGFVGSGNGQTLNGKYAEVIFREYVASARPAQSSTSTDGGGGGGGDGGGGDGGGAE